MIIWREAWVIFAPKNMFLDMLPFYLLSLPRPPQLLQIVSIQHICINLLVPSVKKINIGNPGIQVNYLVGGGGGGGGGH